MSSKSASAGCARSSVRTHPSKPFAMRVIAFLRHRQIEIAWAAFALANFLVMVWHARRRQAALRLAEMRAEERVALLARQEAFLHDVSHELRTPVTIARGHLEVLRAASNNGNGEIEVALDELARMKGIIDRLLLLAKAERPDFLALREIDVEPFLEDVFMRWSEVAPRAWRLGALARGMLSADEEALR